LFAGVGGFDLGFERAGMRIVWQAEVEPYACAVLRRHWPHVPNLGDVRTITAGRAERPDVICGGFPCQDVSIAGRGRGIDGERSGLWREFARIVGDFRPDFAVVENVGAITSRGLARILGDFAAIGFDAEWHIIPAAAVNAPHLRERCWLIASNADRSAIRNDEQRNAPERVDVRDSGQAVAVHSGEARPVADAAGVRMEGHRAAAFEVTFAPILARLLGRDHASGYWHNWPTEPALCGIDDGVSHWAHRMRVLGNAIVPQIAEAIGRAIIESEQR
jgi:DNA (cytosine-5)-methyltransferase 1